ncbi:MAG: Jag N-terminal domain-containing protein [Mailhella sp.]|nr:Jag N-terminal domain-containing protein [Mailhella sp.]
MDESKEFLGKTLDAAIADACAYYGVPREKLEIDIIEDAKTGIFGIVGARKARINAHVVKLPEFMQPAAADPRKYCKKEKTAAKMQPREVKEPQSGEPHALTLQADVSQPLLENKTTPTELLAPPTQTKTDAEPAPKDLLQGTAKEEAEDSSTEEQNNVDAKEDGLKEKTQEEMPAPRFRRESFKKSPRQSRQSPRSEENSSRSDEQESLESGLPKIPLAELDQEKLESATRTIMGKLAAPILGINPDALEIAIEVSEDRLLVALNGDDTGLLIGRDGQNLAAIQYLSTRILSKEMGSQIRLHVDAGDYHMRQDSRLQELAAILADRVRQTGKPQTTRPLSAYQRRVIHLALQDDPDVQTRSSGDGALKHVVILRRKD